MKYSTFIPVVLLSLTSGNVLADDIICKHISGNIAQSIPDPACHILESKSKHFSDVTFVVENYPQAPDVCFSGQLTAILGKDKTPIIGTSYSGITINGIGQLTGATVIRLNAGNVSLGQVYTKDMIIDPLGNTSEALTMVDGSKTFKGGHGSFEIVGNTLYETARFTGMICTQN